VLLQGEARDAALNFRYVSNFTTASCKVIQGHWFWCQSKARMQLPVSPS